MVRIACPCSCSSIAVAVLLVAVVATPARGEGRFAQDSELVRRVVDLLDRRLALMPEVAAYKYRQNRPVSDPVRERAVLEQSVAHARLLHLDGDASRTFFSVQIEMAKGIEERSLQGWRGTGMSAPAARDLVKEIRPELDRLDQELLPAVYLASSVFGDMPAAAVQNSLSPLGRHLGVSPEEMKRLEEALGRMRMTAAPSWDTLRRVGVLRVGTTGDYAPFSEEYGGELHGSDVEMAQSLAKSWGLSLMFVKTSWPSLMSDLAKRRFDLAISGISVTPERKGQADFSAPYFFDGKVPVARRENVARFSTLAGIDQPGVRVIVNPGGTNERFARAQLHRATILVFPDNRTIFDELVAGRADVMITDGVEARLQARRHPELAATMSQPLTHTGKAILLAADSDLTARVDAWLQPHIARGDLGPR